MFFPLSALGHPALLDQSTQATHDPVAGSPPFFDRYQPVQTGTSPEHSNHHSPIFPASVLGGMFLGRLIRRRRDELPVDWMFLCFKRLC